jgi:hypothetical protein
MRNSLWVSHSVECFIYYGFENCDIVTAGTSPPNKVKGQALASPTRVLEMSNKQLLI